jgi:DedD protein
MAFFVLCLLALGLSFFFGLMAGLTGRASPASPAPVPTAGASSAAAAAPAPTGTPEGAEPPSETRIAGEVENKPPLDAPTAPAVLQAFEDRGPDEPTPAPAPHRASAPAPAASAAPAGGTWIQVASLASRSEAEALAGRLTRHGFKAQAAPAQGPKGTVFRVRVGPYRSEPEASRAAERLRRQEKIGQTWIVTEGR